MLHIPQLKIETSSFLGGLALVAYPYVKIFYQTKSVSIRSCKLRIAEFYKKDGTINIITAMKEFRVPLDVDNIDMICTSLERDGYVELFHGSSQVPVGRITGQGKIFFEQGGYRDTTTRLDKMMHWFKNHKVASVIILIFIAVSSLFDLIKELVQWFAP